MRTDDLITALAADAATPVPRASRRVLLALPLGLLVAAIYFLSILGLRPGLVTALHDLRVPFKILVSLSLALTACFWLVRLGRPGAPPGASVLFLLLPVVLLLSAVLLEFAFVPEDQWVKRLVGRNWAVCLINLPLLSLGPLAALLFALRAMAPADPLVAGTAAGLVAAGIGAALYALHCPDDSPLFVAVWYTLAAAITAGIGALVGRKLLAW